MPQFINSKVDEYGFERPEDFDYVVYENFMSDYLKVLSRRSKKWAAFMGSKKPLVKGRKLKRYIRKGIPNEHRGYVSSVNSQFYIFNKNV